MQIVLKRRVCISAVFQFVLFIKINRINRMIDEYEI